jgi:hypothetical protein
LSGDTTARNQPDCSGTGSSSTAWPNDARATSL